VTAADVRVPQARWIVLGAGLIVCGFMLWWSRTFVWYFDEWTFITGSVAWTFGSYFEPHNEHPTMLLKLLYATFLNTVGLRSYVPYMAAVLIGHLANVCLLFTLVRRRAGDLIALVAALLLLVIGMGWEDLLWAFQAGWLASIAFGLAAVLVLQSEHRWRAPLSAALLTISLSWAGTGIVFAVALGVQLLVTPARRRELAWFVGPALALAAWYVTIGRFGQHPNPQPTAANLLIDPLYTVWGLSQGLAGVIGVAGWLGYGLLAAAVGALAWRWRRQGPDPYSTGMAAGLVCFFLVAGLTRAQLGWQQSGASRYVYVAAAIWLVLLGEAAHGLPWRGTWRPALLAVAFLGVFNSAVVLVEYGSAKTLQMQRAVADLQALSAERDDPCLDPTGKVDLLVMPDVLPPDYYRAVDRYGDPAAGKPIVDRTDYETAIANLRKPGC
jgi:hypothetical protein